MAKSQIEKLEQKRQALLDRTALALGITADEARRLLELRRTQSFRVNILKADKTVVDELEALGWRGEQFSWFKDGYSIDEGLTAVRDSQLAEQGKIYIQNAASWLPALALDTQPGEQVLDLCAAPGGKTSHLAALASNQAFITANDNSRPRLARLRANMQRMGVDNVAYTLYDATQIARKLDGRQFDKILLDAPCSGEGMMAYGRDKDFTTWSVAHIKRLEQLQRRLIVQAWQLLKPGGILVYSTCTMAPEENEAVVDYLLRRTDDAVIVPLQQKLANATPAVQQWNNRTYDAALADAVRLRPSTEAEAFFVVRIQKG